MKFNYLSDMVKYYQPLISVEEIDDIVDKVEKERPNLYRTEPKRYLQRVEMDINIYIGNKEMYGRKTT